MQKLTTDQKAKRYEVFEKAILNFLERKIEDAKYDEPETRSVDVVYSWVSDVDDSGLLPEDAYYLIDTILYESFNEYQGDNGSTLPYFKKKIADFKKKIGE